MVSLRWFVVFCLSVSFSFCAVAEGGPVLRFSLPPVLAALPVAFAQEWGLFEAHGVTVELIGITDDLQRSAALLTGNLDGLMSDVTHAVLDASAGSDLVVTAAVHSRPQTGSVTLALLSPVSFRIGSLEELLASNQLIGVLYRSDYEYMLDRMVDSALAGGKRTIRYSPFSDMLQLATMLGAQWLGSAVLPEPYISYIATYRPPGGRALEMVTLADFGEWTAPPSVVVFRRSFLDRYPDAVAAFHAAIAETIERLNKTSREEMVDTGLDVAISLFFQAVDTELIGQDVLDALPIPVYEPLGSLPQEVYEDILAWMRRKGYVMNAPAYASLVDGQFLP